MKRTAAACLLGIAAAFGPPLSLAQQQSADAADPDALARQLANPVAALISVPLQLNYDSGLGPTGDGDRWQLNLQPVIPISLNEDWNIISRTILPIIHQDVPPGGSDSGLGDTVQSLFFSPKKPTANGWILGVGPAFLLPTATEDTLGSEQWGVGPTAVALKQTEDGWTYGALVNHLVSVAGDDDRADLNATFLQPYLVRAFSGGRTASVNLESTYDWEGEAWVVPLNVTYTKVTRIGNQLVSFAIGGRAYLERPSGGPDWGARFTVTLLYPK